MPSAQADSSTKNSQERRRDRFHQRRMASRANVLVLARLHRGLRGGDDAGRPLEVGKALAEIHGVMLLREPGHLRENRLAEWLQAQAGAIGAHVGKYLSDRIRATDTQSGKNRPLSPFLGGGRGG